MKRNFRSWTILLVIALLLTMMQTAAFAYQSGYPGVSIDAPDFVSDLGVGESFTFTPVVTDSDAGKDLTANIVYEAQDIKGVTLTDSNGKNIVNGNCAYEPGKKSFKAPITVTRTACIECEFCLNAYDETGEYKGIIADKYFEFKDISKLKNTLTVKTKKVTVKYSKVKKSSQTVTASKAFTVSKAKGKVSYRKTGGHSKITISKNGSITVKKGIKKGTHNLNVKVTAAGNNTYKSASKNVTVKVVVK